MPFFFYLSFICLIFCSFLIFQLTWAQWQSIEVWYCLIWLPVFKRIYLFETLDDIKDEFEYDMNKAFESECTSDSTYTKNTDFILDKIKENNNLYENQYYFFTLSTYLTNPDNSHWIWNKYNIKSIHFDLLIIIINIIIYSIYYLYIIKGCFLLANMLLTIGYIFFTLKWLLIIIIFLPIVLSLYILIHYKTKLFSLINIILYWLIYILLFSLLIMKFNAFELDIIIIKTGIIINTLESSMWWDTKTFYLFNWGYWPTLVSSIYYISNYANSFDFFFWVLNFSLDSLGLLFTILNIVLLSLCIYICFPITSTDFFINIFISSLLIIISLLNIVFLSADILTFFLAFEISVIPIILIISYGGSFFKNQANNYLIFYTALGAIPILLGILYLLYQIDGINIFAFKYLIGLKFTFLEQCWLWLAFFISFAIKTPIVPIHIWLPKAHVDAPTAGSVILAGLLLKIGLFGFLRLLIPIFPLATDFFAPYVAIFATIGVLYASFITLRQIDIKRIIAYSSVAHINIALVSLCSLSNLGIISSIYIILSHGIITSALFFIIGFLYNRFHQRIITYYGGLATIIPIFTIFFFFFSLANIAFPLTAGFIGEFLCLTSIFSISALLGIINAFSILLTTLYMILLFGRLFLGNIKLWLRKLILSKTKNNKSLITYLNLITIIQPNSFWILNKLCLEKLNINNTIILYINKTVFSTYDLKYYELHILIILLFLTLLLGIYPQIIFHYLISYLNNI